MVLPLLTLSRRPCAEQRSTPAWTALKSKCKPHRPVASGSCMLAILVRSRCCRSYAVCRRPGKARWLLQRGNFPTGQLQTAHLCSLALSCLQGHLHIAARALIHAITAPRRLRLPCRPQPAADVAAVCPAEALGKVEQPAHAAVCPSKHQVCVLGVSAGLGAGAWLWQAGVSMEPVPRNHPAGECLNRGRPGGACCCVRHTATPNPPCGAPCVADRCSAWLVGSSCRAGCSSGSAAAGRPGSSWRGRCCTSCTGPFIWLQTGARVVQRSR